MSEYIGFNSNIKDSSVKDDVDGDEVLKDSNLAFFIILIYVGFIFYFLFLAFDSFFVSFWLIFGFRFIFFILAFFKNVYEILDSVLQYYVFNT